MLTTNLGSDGVDHQLWRAVVSGFMCLTAVALYFVMGDLLVIWKRDRCLRNSNIPHGDTWTELVGSMAEGPRKFLRWGEKYGRIYYFRLLSNHVRKPLLTSQQSDAISSFENLTCKIRALTGFRVYLRPNEIRPSLKPSFFF